MKPIFDPNSAILAEKDGAPIACAVAVPDVNQALRGTDGRLFPLGLIKLLARRRYIDQARLLLLASCPVPTVGIFPLLIVELHRLVRETRHKRVEFRGCSKTTTRSTRRSSASARSATRSTASTRRHRVIGSVSSRGRQASRPPRRGAGAAGYGHLHRPDSRHKAPPATAVVHAPLEAARCRRHSPAWTPSSISPARCAVDPGCISR
jgi:hypothetical protein